MFRPHLKISNVLFALSTVLSQLISHSLSEQSGSQIAYHTLIQQGVLQDCEKILRNIQLLICDCERRNITMNALLWLLKQKEILKNRERLNRIYATLQTAILVDNASALVNLGYKQGQTHEAVMNFSQTSISGTYLTGYPV